MSASGAFGCVRRLPGPLQRVGFGAYLQPCRRIRALSVRGGAFSTPDFYRTGGEVECLQVGHWGAQCTVPPSQWLSSAGRYSATTGANPAASSAAASGTQRPGGSSQATQVICTDSCLRVFFALILGPCALPAAHWCQIDAMAASAALLRVWQVAAHQHQEQMRSESTESSPNWLGMCTSHHLRATCRFASLLEHYHN